MIVMRAFFQLFGAALFMKRHSFAERGQERELSVPVSVA